MPETRRIRVLSLADWLVEDEKGKQKKTETIICFIAIDALCLELCVSASSYVAIQEPLQLVTSTLRTGDVR